MSESTSYQRHEPRALFAQFGRLIDPLLYALSVTKTSVSPAGPWLAGGAILRALNGESQSSDLDFFFRDEAQWQAFCSGIDRNIVSGATESIAGRKYKLKPQRKWLSPDRPRPSVQAVKLQFFDSPEAVLEDFDLTCCQFAYDGEHVVCGPHAIGDLKLRQLRVHRVKNPASTLHRAMRLSRRGFFFASAAATQFLIGVQGAGPEALAAATVSGESEGEDCVF